MANPLLDLDFLKKLDQSPNRETFAKIISLTFAEDPVEEITGKVTQGSINVDGGSAVRRTCSLTMIADNVNISDYYWGLNTKIRLFIGLKNTIDKRYGDIVWFPQGTYILTSFSTSSSVSGFTISLSGKDKMCILNGEVGGSIASLSHNFGKKDITAKDGSITTESVKLKDIIKEAVHEYAKEPYHNIIINDLDECGLELLEYRGDTPIYFLINAFTDEVENIVLNGKQEYTYYLENGALSPTKIALENIPAIKYNPLIELDTTLAADAMILYVEETGSNYTVAKMSFGDTCGYRLTDLTYAGDLIGSAGEAITSILDKIVSMLGEFEYFYDLQGRFVFQKKKTFIKTTWNNIINNQESEYVQDAAYSSAYTYSFENGVLITAYQNSPNLLNLRNDFSIWGKKPATEAPIHLRYAIDNKPTTYVSIVVDEETVAEYNKQYGFNAKPQKSSYFTTNILTPKAKEQLLSSDEYEYGFEKVVDNVDWREIIYQMAKDYLAWNHLDDFEARVYAANGNMYPGGNTGYNQYYTDLISFWRYLYNPDVKMVTEPNGSEYYYIWDENAQDYQSKTKQEVTEFKPVPDDIDMYECVSGAYKKYEYLKEFNPDKEYFYLNPETEAYEPYNIYQFIGNASYYDNNSFNISTHWTMSLEYPENLIFWFDFLDTAGELEQFSVSSVGARPKAVNDSNVTAIYFRNVPTVIFINSDDWDKNRILKPGYTYIELQNYLENFFSISAQGKSANTVLDEFLYNYSYCIESITLTSLPIYHLEPNTRIFVHDKNSGIKGEYIMTKYTLPLSYNGTMSITATKAAESIN